MIRHNPASVLTVCVFALSVLACATSDVIQVDQDTYLVSSIGTSPLYRATVKSTERVYQVARDFCAKKGKIVETESLETVDQRIGRPGSAELRFRCVEEGAESESNSQSRPPADTPARALPDVG